MAAIILAPGPASVKNKDAAAAAADDETTMVEQPEAVIGDALTLTSTFSAIREAYLAAMRTVYDASRAVTVTRGDAVVQPWLERHHWLTLQHLANKLRALFTKAWLPGEFLWAEKDRVARLTVVPATERERVVGAHMATAAALDLFCARDAIPADYLRRVALAQHLQVRCWGRAPDAPCVRTPHVERLLLMVPDGGVDWLPAPFAGNADACAFLWAGIDHRGIESVPLALGLRASTTLLPFLEDAHRRATFLRACALQLAYTCQAVEDERGAALLTGVDQLHLVRVGGSQPYADCQWAYRGGDGGVHVLHPDEHGNLMVRIQVRAPLPNVDAQALGDTIPARGLRQTLLWLLLSVGEAQPFWQWLNGLSDEEATATRILAHAYLHQLYWPGGEADDDADTATPIVLLGGDARIDGFTFDAASSSSAEEEEEEEDEENRNAGDLY